MNEALLKELVDGGMAEDKARDIATRHGIGDTPAIVLIFVSALWPLLLNTIFGVRGIERTLMKVARAARAGEFLVMRDISLPAALPSIFTGPWVSAARLQ